MKDESTLADNNNIQPLAEAEAAAEDESEGSVLKPLQPAAEEQLALLPSVSEALHGDDEQGQLASATWLRKLLSVEKDPAIEHVVRADGVVPRLVELLATGAACPRLQLEAAWALTNVASGTSEQTACVVAHGAVPVFVQLLATSPHEDVREQVVWALGNVAGDGAAHRDLVLAEGAVGPLMAQINEQSSLALLRNATWAISNLFRGAPKAPFHAVAPMLPCLAFLITHEDVEVVTDACWALSYATDGTNEQIQAVLECGVVERLVELLAHPSTAVQTPALRALGNIVTGDDAQTQAVIDAGALPQFVGLLSPHVKKALHKETCWIISNICSGTKEQIASVLQADLAPLLIEVKRVKRKNQMARFRKFQETTDLMARFRRDC